MSDDQPLQKRCSKCGEIKPLDAFHKAKSKRAGRHNQCKTCRAEYSASNAQLIRKYEHEYRVSHVEQERERSRAYRVSHIEQERKRVRAYRVSHVDSIREYQHAYRKANSDVIQEQNRAYRKANPDKLSAKWQRRRARIKGNGGTFSAEELAAMRIEQAGVCAYCQRQYDPDALTVDHVIPIDQGGRHERENIVLACGICNSSKSNRTPEQWTNRWYWRKA